MSVPIGPSARERGLEGVDVALIGTGLAVLLAARRLEAEGRSVLVLNPEYDFFGEDSELSLDPLTAEEWSAERARESEPEAVHAMVAPEYPGSVGLWREAASVAVSESTPPQHAVFEGPTVRTRTRLWISPGPERNREAIEALYVRASDGGYRPQLLEGLAAVRRTPGAAHAAPSEQLLGVAIGKSSDLDVGVYRRGVLEFVRERLGRERVLTGVSLLELTEEGVRYHAEERGERRLGNVRVRERVAVFWTPKLTFWIERQAEEFEVPIVRPRGIRVWEEWRLLSREPLEPGVVASVDDCWFWAHCVGTPTHGPLHELSVLRRGPLRPLESALQPPTQAQSWAGADSFAAISELCHERLAWNRLTIRRLRPRALLEWAAPGEVSPPLGDAQRLTQPIQLERGPSAGVWVLGGVEGSLARVVSRTRRLTESWSGLV